MHFDLPASLRAHGAKVIEVGAYDKKSLRQALKTALAEAEKGVFTTLVVGDGVCLQKVPASAQRVAVDSDVCKRCSACMICPGLSLSTQGVPYANNLCSGCGGQPPACVQACPHGVLHSIDLSELALDLAPNLATPPQALRAPRVQDLHLPSSLALAIRGVGGQGNLFFGRVLTQLAILAGYDHTNIIKGETHGMAQMGGPVISTFACGQVFSPVLRPGSADCLIVMEKSEILRPGFLDLLKPGGTILLAETQIIPFGLPANEYPDDELIHAALRDTHVIPVDVLGQALDLGDASGRCANVVMMGVLSATAPFHDIPAELWLEALHEVSPRADAWALNYAAFNAGRASAQMLALQESW
jgi:indolepyruvate ferredoxin oxidoreductase alpha subunit